jgi:5'-AMP-activated protein kinase catalytic alpha subunit
MVYEVKNKSDIHYVVKMMKHSPNPYMDEFINTEIELSGKLYHEHIIHYIETIQINDKIYIVMEQCDNDDLYDKITKRVLTKTDNKQIFKQIVLGLQYIHSLNIIHSDLKIEHILFKNTTDVRIIDFGLAQITKPDEKMYKTIGTPRYMAPETILNTGYSFPIDIWALGIILFELEFKFNPFDIHTNSNKNVIYERIKKGFNGEIKQGYGTFFPIDIPVDESLRKLIIGMLDSSPDTRWTIQQILDCEWLNIS